MSRFSGNESGADGHGTVRLSYVLPYFRRLRELEFALPYNSARFGRPDCEVVLALDEPSETEPLLDLVRTKYPHVKWRVVVNERDHDWRGPTRAINVGIRHAVGTSVLVASPESLFVDDPADFLGLVDSGDRRFVIGRVVFCSYAEFEASPAEDLGGIFEFWQRRLGVPKFYGSILTRRAEFEDVTGYDESLLKWSGDDVNARIRLMANGVRMTPRPDLRVIHLAFESQVSGKPLKALRRPHHTEAEYDAIVAPSQIRANGPGWGRDFDRVVFDWKAPER